MEWLPKFPNLLLDAALILIVGYAGVKFLRRSRAASLAWGIAILALLCWVLLHYELSSFEGLLRGVLTNLPILLIVLFQPEIRQAFISFGDRIRLHKFTRWRRRQFGEDPYDDIVLAATTLASTRTGALIVIERDISLQAVIEVGVILNAKVTYDLLVTIFNPATPLHDGAVIVRGVLVAAAACYTPLTLNPTLSRDLGTRHRAAIGISEDSDAVVVVVSEETGIISFAQGGQLKRNLDARGLRTLLLEAMHSPVLYEEET